MVKKKLLGFIIVSVIFLMVGCGSKSEGGFYIKNEDYETEDFLDEDTYQVIGYGTWPEEYANKRQIEKRRKARENALLDDQRKIIEIYKNDTLKAKDKVKCTESIKPKILKI